LGIFERLTNLEVVHWFSGGDSVLARGTSNGVAIYHVAKMDGSLVIIFGFTPAYGAWTVAISRDEQWIAVGGPRPGGFLGEALMNRVEIWSLRRRAQRGTVALPHDVGWLSWSPDGRYLAHAPSQSPEKLSVLELLDRATGERQILVPGEVLNLGDSSLTWIR